MLLRRFIEHVKTQNWTAVALDFFIVVVGVFIGIQVSNWNAERQNRADERAIMVRLQSESEAVVGYWREWVAFSEEVNRSRRAFLDAVYAGEMGDGQEQDVMRGIETLFHYPAINPPRAVLDELLASGGFARVSDPTARDAVSSYLAEVEFVDGQLSQFRLNMPQFLSAFEGRVFAVYAPEDPTLRRYEFDLETLSQDQQFKSDIVDLVRDQIVFHNYRVNAFNAATEMCEALSAAIGEQCEPADASTLERTGERKSQG